jgi:predicted Zn-dependent protease with MMP-like domain
MISRFHDDPSLDDLARIAEAALAEIPAEFREQIEGVALRIDEQADDATLGALRIRNPLNLLGLYRGVHIGRKMTRTVVQNVDIIFLYRRAIVAHWRARGGALNDIVRHVLIHEIGHHFGLSDGDMAQIERSPD